MKWRWRRIRLVTGWNILRWAFVIADNDDYMNCLIDCWRGGGSEATCYAKCDHLEEPKK